MQLTNHSPKSLRAQALTSEILCLGRSRGFTCLHVYVHVRVRACVRVYVYVYITTRNLHCIALVFCISVVYQFYFNVENAKVKLWAAFCLVFACIFACKMLV